MKELSWNTEYAHFILTLLWSLFGFALYFLLSRNWSLVSRIWKRHHRIDVQIKQVLLQRAWGFLFLGVLPILIILFVWQESLQKYGLGSSFTALPPWWSYLFIPLILLTGYYTASIPLNLSKYPQIRIKQWTPGILFVSGISWVIFLVGYEFLFRGFVLHASLEVMEPWTAIILNCFLYSLAHFYKGPDEVLGSIPLGILFCYLTLVTGNILCAVIIHSIISLTNEWFSIIANPELKVIR